MNSNDSNNFLGLPYFIDITEGVIEEFQKLHSAPNCTRPVEFAKY
jgi:hypothetical protein